MLAAAGIMLEVPLRPAAVTDSGWTGRTREADMTQRRPSGIRDEELERPRMKPCT